MKKYKITSIPQLLPKAQTGESIDDRNRLKMQKKLKMKRQKFGSKQKDLDPNYGKTDYKGGNLEYNFADAFRNNIFGVDNDENPYPNFDKFDTYGRMRRLTNLRLNDIEQQAYQEWLQQEEERRNNYYTDFTKSKKSDKIKPLYENVDLTSEQIDEYKNTTYIEKNNDGTYSLWPKQALEYKIINNGFKEHQFKNWWGLDSEQVREQMGEFIDWREDAYDESMMNKIYTTAIQEDKSFDQVINELTESGKQGNAAAMKKKYLPQLTDFITKEYDKAFVNPPISPSPVPDGKFKYNEPETKSYPEFDWTDVSGYHRLDGNERHKNKIVFDTPVTKEDFKVEDIYSKHSGKEKKLWDINLSDQKYNEWWINQGGTEAGKQNRLVKLDRINRTTLEDYTDKEKREVIKLYNDSQPKQDLPPPNDYGLYNMAGNVNEWDVDNDKLKTFTESDLIPRPNARFSGYDMSYNPELSDEDLLKILQNNKSDKLTGKSESFLKYMANLKKEEGDKISNNAFSNKDISNDDKLHILSNMFKTSTESDNKNLDANVLEKRDGTNIFNLDSKETDWGNPYDWDSNTYGTYPFADLDSWGSDATKNAETNKLSFSDQYDELYSIDSYTNDLWNKRNKKLNLKTPSKDERTWYTDTWDVVSNLSDAVLAGLDPNKGFWDASNDPRLPRANMTYNEVKEFQRLNSYIDKNGNINDYGDLTAGWGDRLNTASGAMTIPLKLLEGLNPFHIIDEKSRDNSWSRNIDLGIDAAESAAFIIPGAKVATSSIRGLSGLSKFNKFRKAGSAFGKSFGNKEVLKDIGKAYWNYPLHGYGAHALRPEGYMAQGIEDFQKGDYGSGAFNIGMSAPFIPSYLKKAVKTVPLAKAILDPRVKAVGMFNPKTNYGFGFSNPEGKAIYYGNAGANDPGFSKSYFPKTRDKIFDKTGFEIDFRKKIDPSGYRYTSSSFPQLNKEELLLKKFGGQLPKAQTGLSSLAKLIKTGGKNYSKFNLGKDVYKYTPNFTKNILRGINTSTLGTANAIAKTIAPVMINPLTFGLSVEEFGPFTGSPLNFIPFYGKTLPSSENKNPGVAYRKFGDNLDYVKNTGIISPAHGRKFRMGKEQIQGEGNWAEMGNINEKYPGVFAASFDTNVPGTNINITDGRELNRNGVLVREGNNFTGTVPYNSIMDPGVKLHRRLPFSNKYVDVNMDKLRGDKFDPATMGGNLQSLLERYGYAAGIAGGLGLAGINIPQEYLDEYVNNPIKENYIKLKGLFDKPIKKEKDGGMVVNLSQKEIDQYAKEGWIIEDV